MGRIVFKFFPQSPDIDRDGLAVIDLFGFMITDAADQLSSAEHLPGMFRHIHEQTVFGRGEIDIALITGNGRFQCIDGQVTHKNQFGLSCGKFTISTAQQGTDAGIQFTGL